jgi:phosphotriesterase-related protein
MLAEMKPFVGKALTACGPVEPEKLGKVMMHEHLHSDLYDWETRRLIAEEHPCAEERRRYLLMDAVPLLKECRAHGMGAYVDATMPPWRAWPDVYREVSERSGAQIIVSTGFYREIEIGTYFVKTAEDAIWPFVRNSCVEELTEMCMREIMEGIHGTDIHAGAIKLGTSRPPMTAVEIKTFQAGARAQKQTGVHITTHCTWRGSETSQLTILDTEGVDLTRVVVGHTASHLMDPNYRKVVLEWMKRGANFLPTNLGVADVETQTEKWRPLVDGIREVFQAGHGDKLCLGLDSGYCSESGPFMRVKFLPEPPFLHMFTHTLPAFRKIGLTAEEEDWIMRRNPQRIIPVQ